MVAQRVHGPQWTVEQYLAMERESSVKHELIDGYVYAMAGGTRRHDRLARNITRLLDELLEDGPCQVYTLNMKVRLANERDHVYPDASVTCDARDLVDDEADYISYPRLIVEVLSPSTEMHDRGAKFDLYRGRETFQEYVLIETEQRMCEVRTRDSAGSWTTVIYGPEDDLVLSSLHLSVSMATLYRGINL